MPKNKGGRPTIVYTKEMAKTIKDHGASVTKKHLASLLRVDIITLTALLKREPKMRRDLDKVNALTVDEVHNSLLEMCRDKDGPSIRFFLQAKHDDYKPATMLSVEQKIEASSTEIVYRSHIRRFDGSVDDSSLVSDDSDELEAADGELEEQWDISEAEPKSHRDVQLSSAEREMELASSKAEDPSSIFL